MTDLIFKNVRIQFLNENIVRAEYAEDGNFTDAETLFVPDRSNFSGFSGYTTAQSVNGNTVSFGTYTLEIPQGTKSLRGIVLRDADGKELCRVPRTLKNTGELPSIGKTPEVYLLADTPRIRIPVGGYTYRGEIKNSGYVIEEKAQDVYFLLCGKDPKKLRRLYVSLTGRCGLVRLSALGAWNSKYFKYDETSAKQVIFDYEKYDVPLDNMVLDTDWRAASDRGIGYDVDTKLFPDMKRFMDFAHERGVEIMFNDHPEPVDNAESVFAPEEVKYREEKLQGIMSLGLDTWWYDRNWSTALKSPTEAVRPETFGLYLFEEITKHYWQKVSNDTRKYRRPTVMGNVNNIINGTYVRICDSASHRFGIQWTGDIDSDSIALAQEVRSLLRASDNCIPYINADCGGHIGNPDKNMYLRWIQFGVLSPIFRPHCTNYVKRFREPWLYDAETLDIARRYIRMRYRLLPIIYKNAYNAYLSGEPLFRGLGWEYPKDRRALASCDEYMLGKDILIAPVIGRVPVPLKRSHYVSPVTAEYYDGRQWAGDVLSRESYGELAMELDQVSPCKGVPVYDFSARFETDVFFDEDVDLYIRCDDGATVWVDGKLVFKDDTLHAAQTFFLCKVEGGKQHSLRIDYFQAGGQACCGLYYCLSDANEDRKFYLPQGRWMNVFSGKIYAGKKQYSEEIRYDQMPLFVRLGSLLPLAYDAKNVKEQSWNRLVFDYYPDKEGVDSDYLYEDDGETTVYRQGEYRTSAYKAQYDAAENAYIVRFAKAEGAFEGERAVSEREVTIRVHSCGGKIVRASLNGQPLETKPMDVDPKAFPFAAEGGAADGEITVVKTQMDVQQEYEFKFYLA